MGITPCGPPQGEAERFNNLGKMESLPAAWKGMGKGREVDVEVKWECLGFSWNSFMVCTPQSIIHQGTSRDGCHLLPTCLQGKDSGLNTVFPRSGQCLDVPWSIRGTSLAPPLVSLPRPLNGERSPPLPSLLQAGAGPARSLWTDSLIIY